MKLFSAICQGDLVFSAKTGTFEWTECFLFGKEVQNDVDISHLEFQSSDSFFLKLWNWKLLIRFFFRDSLISSLKIMDLKIRNSTPQSGEGLRPRGNPAGN